MDPTEWAFGAACVYVVGMAWFAPRPHCRDCCILAHALMAMWCVAVIAGRLIPDPGSFIAYPVMDLALLVTVAVLWFLRPALWKLVAICTLVASLATHVAFWTIHDFADAAIEHYQLWTNVAFAILLGCASFPTLRNVARSLVGRVPARRGRRYRSSPLA